MRFKNTRMMLTAVLGWSALACCLSAPFFYAGQSEASLWPNQAKNFEKKLRSNIPAVRIEGVQGLANTSASLARSGIILALADSDPDVRKRAAQVALLFEYEGLGPEVTEWLQSRDPQERSLAVGLIARGASADSLTQIGSLLTDPEPAVRMTVARTLGSVAQALSSQAANFLISGLDDPEPEVRLEVAASLGKVGDSLAALAVAAHLQDLEVGVRVQLALALGVLGNQAAVPSLLISLADPDDGVVAAAAQSLGELGADSAVPGLVAVLERTPFKEPGRRAAEALAALGTETAISELLDQLERPEARDHVVSLIESFGDSTLPGVTGCLATAVGADLLACLELKEHFGGGPELRLQMVDEGRLSLSLALSSSDRFPAVQLLIFALEKLAAPESADRLVALGFLEQADRLPYEAARPLREVISKFPWSASETIRLLSVIARCDNAQLAPDLLTFLEATDPAIRAAGASAVVAQGLDGKELAELLQDDRAEVVEGAIKQLRRSQTTQQAELIIRLLSEGKTGRRTLLQSTLLALPKGLSASKLESMFALLQTTNGPERDALLSGFSRNGEVDRLIALARQGSLGDRFKLAQLSFYHPQGARLASELLGDENPRLSAVAALALGRTGEASDVEKVAALALPRAGRPRYLQAAALQSLRWFHERSIAAPASVLSESVCTSQHTALQVRALELAASLGKKCPGADPRDLLANSSNARVRQAVALGMQGKPEFSQALKRCATYETRAEIAEICRFQRPLPGGQQLPPEVLPFEEIEVRSPFEAEAPPLTPATFEIEGEAIAYVTDRRGRLLVPALGVRAADLVWAY